MKTEQAILKCNKKAWQEIKNIQNAPNMACVEQSISDAIEKTFGLWDRGILMIRMRKLGAMGALEADRMIGIRRDNYDRHHWVVCNYLIRMIPSRLFNSLIYKRLTNQIR